MTTFDDLLVKENSFGIHRRNLQKLVVKIFKMNITSEVMILPQSVSSQNETKTKSHNIRAFRYGIETSFLEGPRM